MEKVILLISLSTLLTGCSWIGHKNHDETYTRSSIPGVDINPGRGTTGVSSGADLGWTVTGSDLAPR